MSRITSHYYRSNGISIATTYDGIASWIILVMHPTHVFAVQSRLASRGAPASSRGRARTHTHARARAHVCIRRCAMVGCKESMVRREESRQSTVCIPDCGYVYKKFPEVRALRDLPLSLSLSLSLSLYRSIDRSFIFFDLRFEFQLMRRLAARRYMSKRFPRAQSAFSTRKAINHPVEDVPGDAETKSTDW